MPKYEKHTLLEAAKLSMDNATEYLKEANKFKEEERYGRALSLSILGREEAQKSILLSYCASGLYDPSDTIVGTEIKRALHEHDYKHESAWYVNAFGVFLIQSVSSNKEAAKKVVDNLKRIASPKDDSLEKLKWTGLYVGIDRSGRITHPGDITKQECEEFLQVTSLHWLLAKGLRGLLFSEKAYTSNPFLLQAEQFRLLMNERPLTLEKINQFELEDKLTGTMSGFARFLVEHNLIL